MRSPQSKKLLSLHFSRITSLREELEVEDTTAYHRDPSSEILSDVFSHSALSVDLETTGFVPERGEIEMVGASIGPGRSIVAVGESRHAYEWLKRAETDESITVIGQNWMQYDAWWVWQKWGIGPPARCFDTRLAGHLLNPDTPNNIIYLTQEFAKPPIRGYWKTRNHYRDDKIGVCLIDCDATFRVERGQETQLLDENLMGEYWNEVYPVMKVAFNMRRGGWRVDRPALAIANTRVAASVVEGRKALPEWPGVGKTDIRTENQHEAVKDYLYTTLRLPVQLNSKTHQPASGWEEMTELDTRLKNGHSSVEHLTSAEVAEALRFIPLVLGLRDQSKLLTFLNPDSQFLSPKNFFHPTWNPAGTATFRFACQDPNLMQVPKCTCDPTCYGENPKCVNARFPFIGDEDGWVIGSTDYSQIEVIGFLWAAGQWDVLRRVLLEGLDAHAVMGEQMGMMRKDAKHMTFALVYGASDETIAAKSGKPVHVVAEARAHYMKVFSGVKEFRWRYISQAMEHGFVESPFGRRRYLWVQQPIGRAANQAANAPIQGIPPMIVRRAMIRLDKELPKPARILGNIHDELVWTCPKEMLPEVVECITDVMRSPIPEMPAMPLGMGTGLVLNVDTEVGPDWSRCVKYETTKN
jgi:DNA polymerase-1